MCVVCVGCVCVACLLCGMSVCENRKSHMDYKTQSLDSTSPRRRRRKAASKEEGKEQHQPKGGGWERTTTHKERWRKRQHPTGARATTTFFDIDLTFPCSNPMSFDSRCATEPPTNCVSALNSSTYYMTKLWRRINSYLLSITLGMIRGIGNVYFSGKIDDEG